MSIVIISIKQRICQFCLNSTKAIYYRNTLGVTLNINGDGFIDIFTDQTHSETVIKFNKLDMKLMIKT